MLRVPAYAGWPVAIASAYGGLYYFANRSIYYPMKYPAGFWDAQRELGAADVSLETSDGVRLHAWWVGREGTRLATLFLHGNAGNVTHRATAIREIVAAGSSILMLDYRGYGKSEGRPTERGLYIDAATAYAHLLERGYRAEQIILHGESLGTAVAVELASRRKCAALVLEAPFTSGSEVAGTVLPGLGPLLVRSFNSLDKIRAVAAPKLFIHGDRDDIIPLQLGQKLFAVAPEPKSLWIVKGAGHNDLLDSAGARYRERLREFYSVIGRE